MPDLADYDARQDGSAPEPAVLAMLTSPAALRARAAIRIAIADQDRAHRDTWAEQRNRQVGHAMLTRAAEAGA